MGLSAGLTRAATLVGCLGGIAATTALFPAGIYPEHSTATVHRPLATEIAVWPNGMTPPGDEGHEGAFGPNETESCFKPGTPVSRCIDVSISNVSIPTLTPFIVPGADSAVVVAPGGAYHFLAFNREGTDIAAWLNSIGVSAFVLKYRVPGRPWLPFGAAPLKDAQRAIRLVRQMAGTPETPKLSPHKIGFMGFSAGGHLTGHVNVAWPNETYPPVDAADALSTRPDFAMMVYPWQSVTQSPVNAPVEEASALNVTALTPPTMLVQAEDDPVHCENALFYFHALKLSGAAPSELHIYPRGGHGYGRCTVSGAPWHEVCTWPDRGQMFMQWLGMAPNTTAPTPRPLRHAAPLRVMATPSTAIPLYPGNESAPGDGGHPGAIPPESVGCLTRGVPMPQCKDSMVTDVTVPTVIPYLAPGAFSAVIIAPGGAYHGLAIDREGTDIAAWLNSIGVSAFVLKYRVPDRAWLPFGAEPLMDAQRSMGLVRQLAAKGKIGSLNASSKIGFMGFSAGSHLTGHLNVAWKTRTYPRVDDADDLPCRPDFAMMVYPWESVTQAPVNATAEQATAPNITKDTPPTMLIQAEDDPVHVENALFYFLALKDAGAAPSELHVYPQGGHGYGRCTVSGAKWNEVCTWPNRGNVFMRTLGVAPNRTVLGGRA